MLDRKEICTVTHPYFVKTVCPLSQRHGHARLPSCCCGSLAVLLLFVFFACKEIKRRTFPFPASFGSDQQQVPRGSQGDIWGLWSLFTACFCQSLRDPLYPWEKQQKSQMSNIWSRLIIICGYHFPFACLHAMSHSESECQYRDWNYWLKCPHLCIYIIV